MNIYLSRLYGSLGLLIICAVLLVGCGDSSGQDQSQATHSSSTGNGGVRVRAVPSPSPATGAPTVPTVAASGPTQANHPTPIPPTPTQVTYPNIAGSYSGSYTWNTQAGTNPMQMQISQSGPNLTGTTTEGSVVYNDTGTINTSGSFSITETSNGTVVAYLYGSIPSANQLSGTWSNTSSGGGSWSVSK